MYVFTYTRSMINTRVYSIWKSGPQYYRKESVHTYTYNTRRSKNTKFKWKDSIK